MSPLDMIPALSATTAQPAKHCKCCGTERPLVDFPPHNGSKDGRRLVCRACLLSQRYEPFSEDRKARNRRRKRERKAPWQSTHRRALDKWEARNPHKVAAVRALGKAVRIGLVKKATCCQVRGCKSRKHLEGHHWDYSQPLDVLWTCAKHHRRGHYQGFIVPKRGLPAHMGRIPDMDLPAGHA